VNRDPIWIRISDNTKASVIVEFALIASFLCVLLVGIVNLGMALWRQMQVGNAARAGAAYASVHGWNNANIQAAAVNATSLTIAPSATLVNCGCPDTNQGIVVLYACPAKCANTNTTPGQYVIVTVQATYSPILTYPGVNNPATLHASAYARIN
jgi:Flp pilus assembly protein TadG